MVHSIFTWRRPDVSRRYLFFLIVAAFGTLVLPAQYVAKLVYWFGGILFWHVTPVVASLPRGDRTRQVQLFPTQHYIHVDFPEYHSCLETHRPTLIMPWR
jgi:hypothetical protein